MPVYALTAATRRDLRRRFTHHPPHGDQPARHDAINTLAYTFAAEVCTRIPEGRERALFLTALQEARMWANAAIAVGEAPDAVDAAPDAAPPDAPQGG